MVQAAWLHYVIYMYFLLQPSSGGCYNYPPLQVRQLSLKETEALPPRSLAMLVLDLNSSRLNSKDGAVNPQRPVTASSWAMVPSVELKKRPVYKEAITYGG